MHDEHMVPAPSPVWKKFILPVVIVVAGIVAAKGLIAFKPSASRQPGTGRVTPTVQVRAITVSTDPAQLTTTGTVLPAVELALTPQVTGRIIQRNSKLIPGSYVKQGDMLAQIDPQDYAIKVRQEKATARKAQLELEMEQGRKTLAQREWELLSEHQSDRTPTSLSSRESHIDAARAAYEAAQGALERAKLDLSRTTLRAPFDAIVVDQHVQIGQVVSAQTVVATLIGTDNLWVKVNVPVDMLQHLAIPGMNRDSQAHGSVAVIQHDLGQGAQNVERTGYVLRLLSQLDPQTRTAQLLINIPKPFANAATQSGATQPNLPLLPGAFVRVTLSGETIPNTFAIPRAALHEGHTVWVAVPKKETQGAELLPRRVEVQWGNTDQVFVRGDLAAGEHIVTSPLAVPVAGMAVQLERQQ